MTKWTKLLFAFTLITLVEAANASSIVYESSTIPDDGSVGFGLSQDQFIGSRFRLETITQITGIGGFILDYFSFEGEIFAALVSLSSIDATVDDVFLQAEYSAIEQYSLASTILEPGMVASDIIGEVDILLQPGIYAIVIGGLLSDDVFVPILPIGGELLTDTLFLGCNIVNATSVCFDFEGTDPYFAPRFLVLGSTVPIPPTALLLVSSLFVFTRRVQRYQ